MKNLKKSLLGAGMTLAILSGCAPKQQATETLTLSGLNPSHFEAVVDSVKPVKLYTLKNAAGMEVCVTNFGGRIVSIMVPDKNGEMKDVVVSCDYLDENLEMKTMYAEEMKLSYRHSIFCEKNYIIIGVLFRLEKGDKAEITAKMSELMDKRRSKQPLEYPSAGSVFKRPAPDLFVGKMIEDSGLKGYTVGGAQVSEKHAGFIINIGNATAGDVLGLVEHIKGVIRQNYGVELECEIRRVGCGE